MTTNCQPGDIAVIVAPKHPDFDGRLVRILCEPPPESFVLPDGQLHAGEPQIDAKRWVIEFLDGEVPAPVYKGGELNTRQTRYGVGRDCKMVPVKIELARLRRELEVAQATLDGAYT